MSARRMKVVSTTANDIATVLIKKFRAMCGDDPETPPLAIALHDLAEKFLKNGSDTAALTLLVSHYLHLSRGNKGFDQIYNLAVSDEMVTGLISEAWDEFGDQNASKINPETN